MEVIIYQTETGKIPFQAWLDKLKDRDVRAIINARLDRVEIGNLGDSKYLKGGVWELKFNFGPGYRIYFSKLNDDTLILLLSGGTKKSQEKDIDKAIDLLTDFKERYEI